MSDEANTEPTIQTILERIELLRSEVTERLDRIETTLDRTASVAFETRADLRELKGQLRDMNFVK